MRASLGRITARLAEPEEAKVSGLIQLLNANIDPPSPLSGDDVHIRAMYIVSDEVNSYGGRFPTEEHARMCELLIDSPVMVGHRKDKLPIGRNFHAVQIERDGRRWIKSYFYWLKSAESAANLRDNIDGGIYKECSVGFTFHLPECSICGKDIRLCPHEPFETYTTEHGEEVCHFNYRRIERVLETSLVYRGAIPDTSVSKELRSSDDKRDGFRLMKLENAARLEANRRYLIIPRYESIPVAVNVTGGRLSLMRSGGTPVPDEIVEKFPLTDLPESVMGAGRLVGYRGKARCGRADIESFLKDGSGPVSRLVLHVVPGPDMEATISGDNQAAYDVRTIPYRIVGRDDVDRKAREICTRMGVEVWPLEPQGDTRHGFLYRPTEAQELSRGESALCWNGDTGAAVLSLKVEGDCVRFSIERFNALLLLKGRRFAADLVKSSDPETDSRETPQLEVPVERVCCDRSGLSFRMGGDLRGEYLICPFTARGSSRYLFFKTKRQRR